MKLFYKISLHFTLIGFFTLFSVSYISHSEIKKSFTDAEFERLTAIRDGKKREIESYFHTIQEQLITLSSNLMTIEATDKLGRAFNDLNNQATDKKALTDLTKFYNLSFTPNYVKKTRQQIASQRLLPDSPAAQQLQFEYIAHNPEMLGNKSAFIRPETENAYNRAHAVYHPIFKTYQERHHFYDIFLIDLDGHVIYSVFKETDFATDLINGPYKNSGLSKSFRQAKQATDSNSTFLIDFEPYIPSYGAAEAFISSPIEHNGKRRGFLIFQIPIDQINSIMTSDAQWAKEGLGKTGEAFIVADDFGMRNNSRFLLETPERYLGRLEQHGYDRALIDNIRTFNTTIHFQKVRTEAAVAAHEGQKGTQIIEDDRGIQVLSSYTPLQVNGVNWALLAEIDYDEVFEPIHSITNKLVLFAILLTLILIVFSIQFSRKLTSPLNHLVTVVQKIAAGHFNQKIAVKSHDEVGKLASAFNHMTTSLEKSTVSKDYVDRILSSMNESLFVLKATTDETTNLKIQTINEAATKLLGLEEKDILGKPITSFLDEPTIFTHAEFKKLMRTSSIKPSDKTLINSSGHKIPVLFSASLMQNSRQTESDTIVCVCVAQDITERKRSEEKLKLSAAVFNNSKESIIITNTNGNIIDCNPSFEFTTGYSKIDIFHANIDNLKVKEPNILSLGQLIKQTNANSTWRGELTLQLKNGDDLPCITSCSAVTDLDENIINYVLVLSDISDLKEKELRILEIANHDPLTGLPNRGLFKDRFKQTIKECKRNDSQMALIFLDLDEFKEVNDTYGHQAGDELLIEVAVRVQHQLRASDTVARMGGDEFVVILNDIQNTESSLHISEKIRQAIDQPFLLTMTNAKVSSSIGIACYPEHTTNAAELIKLADRAMYESKNRGKNTITIAQSTKI